VIMVALLEDIIPQPIIMPALAQKIKTVKRKK